MWKLSAASGEWRQYSSMVMAPIEVVRTTLGLVVGAWMDDGAGMLLLEVGSAMERLGGMLVATVRDNAVAVNCDGPVTDL